MRKKRKARRWLGALLCLAMTMGMLPTVAMAAGTASFSVEKKDTAGNLLEGAQFKLQAGQGGAFYTARSLENGKATFDNVPDGTYELSETAAPFGYTKSDKTYTVVINTSTAGSEVTIYKFADEAPGDGGLTVTPDPGVGGTVPMNPTPHPYGTGETIVTYYNAKLPTYTVLINKTGEGGMPLAGAEFSMVHEQEQVPFFGESDANGVITFDLPEGTYTLNETRAPFGYLLMQEQYRVQVGEELRYWGPEGGDSMPYPAGGLTVANTEERRFEIVLPITKTVERRGTHAPGQEMFTFELWVNDGEDQHGNHIYQLVDEANILTQGEGTTEHELVFQAPESVATMGPLLLKEKQGNASGWTYSMNTYQVEARPTHIMAAPETDQQGPHYVFHLVTEDGEWGEGKDWAAFTNIYTYNGPKGMDATPEKTITVRKTDPQGKPLSGAVFVLENSRGDAMYTATTNSRGEVSFADVVDGIYTLRENAAPTGYVKSDESYRITVDGSRISMDGKAYMPVTFINNKAVELNRDDHSVFLVGYADGTFGPDRNMTRAEVTVMFARLITERIAADKTYPNTFTDVPATHWAANYIGFMQQFGVVVGFNDGTFRPDAPVTRAQFAAIASRFEKLTAGEKSFADVPNTHWAAKYINFAATRGWVSGYADGTFKPENPITRAEVAAVTCRLLERSADQSYIRSHLNELRTYKDMNESHWAYWYTMEAGNSHDYTKADGSESWSQAQP